jgi:hypothetical protein
MSKHWLASAVEYVPREQEPTVSGDEVILMDERRSVARGPASGRRSATAGALP